MNITVLGAGAWGTALAIHASAAHATRLWARNAEQINAMQASGCNDRYLPNAALPSGLQLNPRSRLEVETRHAGLDIDELHRSTGDFLRCPRRQPLQEHAAVDATIDRRAER